MSKKMRNQSVNGAAYEVSAPEVISLDLGNAYCNLVASGGLTANWRSVQGRVSDAQALSEYPFDAVIKLNGELWAFGEAAFTYAARSLEDFPSTNRYTSQWYKRLFAYALHRAFGLRIGAEIYMPNVVLSIPARYFANESFAESVKALLCGEYHIGTVKDTVTRVSVTGERLKLIPEGVGAYLATSQGRGAALEHGLWLVVDVGYLTTDIVAFLDGDYMPDMAASDPNAGISTVANAIARHVLGKTGVDLKPVEIDRQLTCDSLTVNGVPIDIRDVRHTAFTALVERVGKAALSAAAGQNVTGVILTGGRADTIQHYWAVKSLPAPIVAPEPAYANATGGYLLLTS